MGNPDTLTQQALQALQQADAVFGAARLLDILQENVTQNRIAEYRAPAIAAWLETHTETRCPCVLYSGDPGLYSGAAALRELAGERGWQVETIPGISTLSYFCARLGIPWQDVQLVSGHGVQVDVLAAVLAHPSSFFLTGGATTPNDICRILCEAGLGETPVWVGEKLSYPEERIVQGRAEELCARDFAPLSAVLVRRNAAVFCWPSRSGGIPDTAFVRGDVPMSKMHVRAAILSALCLREEDIVWDIGAGTGSVAVEAALAVRRGRVYAVEKNPAACELIEHNRRKFGVYNVILRQGTAPQACGELPAPNAVFIGGSGGQLEEIFSAVAKKNPRAGIVMSAVTVESMHRGLAAMQALGWTDTEAVQLAVSRAEKTAAGHLLRAQNPVFILKGGCKQ